MPYATFDDSFCDHPKIAGLTDSAFRLHTAGILYCARHLTDGLIPADEVPRLVRRYRKASLVDLTDRALWVPAGGGQAYTIHDYLDWNLSRGQVEKRRLVAQQNGKKGGRR
jgi:hypothetical protein